MFDGTPYSPVEEIARLEEWVDNRSLCNRRRRDDDVRKISSYCFYTGSYGYNSNFPVMTNCELRYFIGWREGHHGKNGGSFGMEGEVFGGKKTGEGGADFGWTGGRPAKKAPITPEIVDQTPEEVDQTPGVVDQSPEGVDDM